MELLTGGVVIPVVRAEGVVAVGIGRIVLDSIVTAGVIVEDIASVEVEVDERGIDGCNKQRYKFKSSSARKRLKMKGRKDEESKSSSISGEGNVGDRNKRRRKCSHSHSQFRSYLLRLSFCPK